MKKLNFLFIALFLTITNAFAQLGVNTTDPKATLDVVAKSTETDVADGIILPRLSLADLNAKTSYSADQTGATIYITDVTAGSTTTATASIADVGFYFFDGTKWVPTAENTVGDIKSGIQAADHKGWVKLDGRAISGLTTTQQANATAMGLNGNLPDASNSYLSQNGSTLGDVDGTNSKTIARNNLPNVTLSGTTSTTGSHSHDVILGIIYKGNGTEGPGPDGYTGDWYKYGSKATTNSKGSHRHSFTTTSINGGTTQQSIDITPKSLSVNMFVYLGN